MAETLYRQTSKKGWTTIYRSVAQDDRLTLKARGLFLLMQSLPENWAYTISGLAAKAGTGKDQIRAALQELEKVGYLIKDQAHDSGANSAAMCSSSVPESAFCHSLQRNVCSIERLRKSRPPGAAF